LFSSIDTNDVKALIGKRVVAIKKDGTPISGKLARIRGRELIITPINSNKATTKAIIPLALFDLLAIGTYGAYGAYGGYGYPGAYGGYPGAFGYPAAYDYPGAYGYPGYFL